MRLISVWLLAIAGAAAGSAALGATVLDDVYMVGSGHQIRFGNSALELMLDDSDAHVVGLIAKARNVDLVAPGADAPAFDVRVDDEWLGAGTIRLQSTDARSENGRAVLRLGMAAPDWRATVSYSLEPGGSCLEKGLALTYTGTGTPRLTGLRFPLPGLAIEPAGSCSYTMPAYGAGRTPYADLRPGRTLWSGFDECGAWATVHNAEAKVSLAASFYTGEEDFALVTEEGAGWVRCRHEIAVLDRLKQGYSFSYGTQYIQLVPGTYEDGLRAARDTFRLAGVSYPADRPEWATHAAMYSLHAGGTIDSGFADLGGLKAMQKLLPVWHDMGIDTVWLLPYCPGCYGPLDYYAIDPRLGTAQDLKDTIALAHELDMRVLLDLVPHGPRDTCDVAKGHPDWVSLAEDGSPLYRWGCVNMDYNNPGWQGYIAGVATHFVREYGADGWRVDVAPGGDPNWSPARAVRPSQSRPYGGRMLLAKVRAEMKKAKADSILFPEGTGPHMFESGDLLYDYPFFSNVLARFHEEPSPAEWRRKASEWLELQKYSFPEGATAGLVRFIENHDQVRSAKYWGVGVARALMAICVLSEGVPMIYHNQEVGFAPYYHQLLATRRRLPELTEGEASYTAVRCSDPNVFTCLRRAGEQMAVVAVNLAGAPSHVELTLPELGRPAGPPSRLAAYDVFGDVPADMDGSTVRTILDAYSPAVIAIRPDIGIAAMQIGLRDRSPREKQPQGSAPDVQTSDDGDVRVANGIYRTLLSARRGGLMTSLRLGGESRADLLRDADVCEGRRKVWGDGPPARLSDAASRPPDVVREGETTRIIFRGIIRKGPPEQEAACADYELEYRCDASPRIGVRFRLRPTVSVAGMNGELLNMLTLGEMTNWFVQTVEGPLHDDFVVRTTGQRIPSGMYWHPVGDRLWESRLQPLDPAVPIVGAYHSDLHEFIAIANPRCSLPGSPGNVYLTDVTETGRQLRLVLGIFDRRGMIPPEADAGFEWSYDVIVGRGGYPEALQAVGRLGPPEGAPQLSGCGSAYTVENGDYRAVVAKGGGGTIRQLVLKSADDAVVLRGSDIYTDNGIYPRETNEGGFLGLAAARGDFEPDVSIRREGGRLILSFSSLLRNSYQRWAHYATPSIEYRETYEFDASPDIKATVSVRPLIALTDTPAFLSWVGQFADTTRWFANAKGGWREGATSADVGRAWEAKREGLSADEPVIGVANDDRKWFVALSDIRADRPMENTAFNHVSGDGRVGIFLAWHDFEKAPIVPEWKTLRFTIRPGRGDPRSVLRGR